MSRVSLTSVLPYKATRCQRPDDHNLDVVDWHFVATPIDFPDMFTEESHYVYIHIYLYMYMDEVYIFQIMFQYTFLLFMRHACVTRALRPSTLMSPIEERLYTRNI